MFEDDDEEIFGRAYENGHWEWDTEKEQLVFLSDLPPMEDEYTEISKTCIRSVEFRDDIDLWEQQKFKKRYQRRTTENDVVTLQDVKDVVLYTTPAALLSPAVINMLHLPATERFLRALILCCQYHLQVSDSMSHRTIELESKIRTEESDEIESKYREDLQDLRLLVAKEYAFIVLGDEEFSQFHHYPFGNLISRMRSLSTKDASLFETIIIISIQIVWIALGRKYYDIIALEVNRLIKSDLFNSTEFNIKKNGVDKMDEREKSVLLGRCVCPKKKVNTRSPLMNELFCHRDIDYRLLGLGTIRYTGLTTRLRYLEVLLSEPERRFVELGISLGIIGLARDGFDIMLREIPFTTQSRSSSTSSASVRQSMSRPSKPSRVMSRKSTASTGTRKLYPDIRLPEKGTTVYSTPNLFPDKSLPKLSKNDGQRRKWMRQVLLRRKKRISKQNIRK